MADLHHILTAIDRAIARGTRDAAVILLGFAGALRRHELAALTLAGLEAKPAGLLPRLRRSMTDPDARGEVVGVARGRHRLTDPVAAQDAWLAVCGTAPGPVFTNLRGGAGVSLRSLSGNTVTGIVRQ